MNSSRLAGAAACFTLLQEMFPNTLDDEAWAYVVANLDNPEFKEIDSNA